MYLFFQPSLYGRKDIILHVCKIVTLQNKKTAPNKENLKRNAVYMRFLKSFGDNFFNCHKFALTILAAEAAEYDYCDEYDDPKAVIIIESIGKTTAHVDFLLPQ